jgi:L-fuculose-phosphate aldolase
MSSANAHFDEVRCAIVATCLELANKGYLAGTGGNVACRIDIDTDIDDEYFAVTPSATDYYAMRPDDICVLRLRDCVLVAGERRPSVEHHLHANILRARRDCRASIHTHQPIASAYSLLGRELEIRHPRYQSMLGAKAALVGYAPSGTSWLARKLEKALRPEINAYLMRNHGVVCCGPTLAETVTRVEALEAACAHYFQEAIEPCTNPEKERSRSEVLMLLADLSKMESVS